ncbi:MAG TPA: ribosomal protein L7/L12, partial [Bacillota bacterium]|nr:ribosomal protein L7/L12 [Bacillota bacterium]
MNYGPLIFLAAFFALSSSWFGLVLAPQLQVGRLQQTNTVATGASYPLARPGLAQQGRDVYRANGCASCHSQQVGQTATVFELTLNEAGTNHAAVVAALQKVKPGLTAAVAQELLSRLPHTLLEGATKEQVDAAAKTLAASGAKAQPAVV